MCSVLVGRERLLNWMMPIRWLQRGARTVAVMGLAVGAWSCGHAQISLSTAVDLALHNDPKVHMAQADLDHAKAALSETRDAYIPSVSVSGGYGDGTGAPLSVPVVFGITSQSLLFNFSQRDNLRAAEAAVEAAKLALKEVQDKVAEDVVITYIDLDNAEQRQAAKTQALEYATRLVTIVSDRLDAGQDTKIDLLTAKQTAAQLHLDELHAEDDVATLAEHLLLMMGLPGERVDTIPASIPALPDFTGAATDNSDSYGVSSAAANARAKQEYAFGLNRYLLRPQIALGANYSRITTTHTSYTAYYPGFKGPPGYPNSDNSLSIGIQIEIPLLDWGHQAKARQAQADANRARYDADDARKQFMEGRFKLRHSLAELSAKIELAQDSRELAQAQLDATVAQLSASSSATGGAQMTPKDEQNARLSERQKYVDFLNSQLDLDQVEVNLLRQTGELDGWLKTAAGTSPSAATGTVKPQP
jgi:outer membrane protein TolC